MLIKTIPVGQLETNCYVVTDEKSLECAVIDPGDESNTILDYIEENHLKCKAIMLTHGHYDHVCAVLPVMEETGATVYMNECDSHPQPGDIGGKFALPEGGVYYGEGDTVTAQLPGSGAVVANGSTILLYAGKEPSADKETMPDLTNLSYQTARDRMAALGLYIKTNSSITDTAQIVSGQTVAAGTQLDHGTVVEVTLVTSDSSMLGRY